MSVLLSVAEVIIVKLSAACCSEECSGFKHLENGRTFFRYGGLLVIFSCHHGYKLHGYKTNSCVSGHWSRDPPVCVGEEFHSSSCTVDVLICFPSDGSLGGICKHL